MFLFLQKPVPHRRGGLDRSLVNRLPRIMLALDVRRKVGATI